ncbi:MAG: EamA family transporter, partial [Verrucomicrobiae bacterium]|nr:EamA family transporter [Verrucomicrobiae bacterium]
TLIILILALCVEALGVVFLSRGLKQLGEPPDKSPREIARLIVRGARNPNVLLGVALEAAFFGALLYLLSQRDVSLVWPLTALGFVITALAAKFILKEEVSALRWAGVLLIVIGAALVSYSARTKPKSPPPEPPSVADDARR